MSKDTILSSIEDAVEDFRQGKFLIVVDDEDRENEGDFIIAAEAITPEKVNFMLANGRGVLCAPITMQRCEELNLYRQVNHNTSMLGTPFTVTIDKLEGDRCFEPRQGGYDTGFGRSFFDARDIRASRTYKSSLCPR